MTPDDVGCLETGVGNAHSTRSKHRESGIVAM